MSLSGPSALGTLLISRLDAALGVTLSQQTNLAAGARPEAVSQAVQPERVYPIDDAAQRHPQEHINRLRTQMRHPHHHDSTSQRQNRHPGTIPIDAVQRDLRTGPTSAGPTVTSVTATASAPTSLGAAAQIILALLGRYPDSAAPVAGRLPLVQHSPTPSTGAGTPAATAAREAAATDGSHLSSQLLIALRNALKDSGLFYESHLARLSTGRHPRAELMHEPQAQLVLKSSAHEQTATPGVHPAAHLMVRQQLEAFAYQQINWQGEAWPHAPITLTVQRGHEETPGEPASHWASRLTVQLPCLGSIEARVTLAGQQLTLLLFAPQTSSQLADGCADLRQHLSARQITLSAFAVTATPPDTCATHISETDSS